MFTCGLRRSYFPFAITSPVRAVFTPPDGAPRYRRYLWSPARTDIKRQLAGPAPHAPGLIIADRLDVLDCSRKNLQQILSPLPLHCIHCYLTNGFGRAFLAGLREGVGEVADQLVLVPWVSF